MNPIDDVFRKLRGANQKAFIPFVTAGDPSISAITEMIRDLDSAGCHLIEIGFPFSDPIADGPVIQASYTRALDRGVKLGDVFGCARAAQPLAAPLIAMVSYTLVFRRGPEAFVEHAKKSGFSGIIVPDLPAEEAEEFAQLCARHNIRNILLITPTTPPERAKKILKLTTGFVYCVSVAGITGERDKLPEELLGQLRWLRSQTDLPLCVGFGISKPEHVHMLREEADGVIVGSAIVRCLENAESADWSGARARVRDLCATLMHALNSGTH